MERVLATHTVTGSAESMSAPVLDSDSDDTKNKLQLPSNTVVRSSSNTKSKIEHVLANLDVLTKVYVEAIHESCLTKWTSTLQSQIKVAEQALGEKVQSGRAPALSDAEMESFVQTKSVADTIVKSELSNMRLLFQLRKERASRWTKRLTNNVYARSKGH